MTQIDPQLAAVLPALPPFETMSGETLPALRALVLELCAQQKTMDDGAGVIVQERHAPNANGPAVRMLVYTPANAAGPLPAVLHLHGGGQVSGVPEMGYLAGSISCARKAARSFRWITGWRRNTPTRPASTIAGRRFNGCMLRRARSGSIRRASR